MKNIPLRAPLLFGGALMACLALDVRSARGSICPSPEFLVEVNLQPQYHVGAECGQRNDLTGHGLTPPIYTSYGAILSESEEVEFFVCPLQNQDDDREMPEFDDCEDTAGIRVLDQHPDVDSNVVCVLAVTDPENLVTIQSPSSKATTGASAMPTLLPFDEFNPYPWDSWFFACEIPQIYGGDRSGVVSYYMNHKEFYTPL
jgi:hypothetical protein